MPLYAARPLKLQPQRRRYLPVYTHFGASRRGGVERALQTGQWITLTVRPVLRALRGRLEVEAVRNAVNDEITLEAYQRRAD